jgi:hypothetical protein
MRINKAYIAVGLMIAFMMFFELAAHADESNQATKITFSAPIQIPGQVLPAGTYLFKVEDSDANIVQIFNGNGTALFATVQTIATERPNPADHTIVTLAEPEAGQPGALLKWFYPGDQTGHEFLYSSQKEKELAQDTQRTILAEPTNANSDTQGGGN